MSGQDLVSDQGLRIDGRRSNELRRINVRMGVFGQSDGSAYLEQGNTKVLAAVYGPHQVLNHFLSLFLKKIIAKDIYGFKLTKHFIFLLAKKRRKK